MKKQKMIFKFQKRIARQIAVSVWHRDHYLLSIPAGYGKVIIMQEATRLLKRLSKGKRI